MAPGQFIGERGDGGNLQQILAIVQRLDLPSLVLNDVSLNAIPYFLDAHYMPQSSPGLSQAPLLTHPV